MKKDYSTFEDCVEKIKPGFSVFEYNLIKNFIEFLENEIFYYESIKSSQRVDIHRWMIQYLERKLMKLEKE